MKNTESNASKNFRASQRPVPYKIENSWNESCEHYANGKREGYQSDGRTRKKNGDIERRAIFK